MLLNMAYRSNLESPQGHPAHLADLNLSAGMVMINDLVYCYPMQMYEICIQLQRDPDV